MAEGSVFAIYEVLEGILLHLPMRDLLNLQRVNKTFQHVIERSVPLQQSLYLLPNPTSCERGEGFGKVNTLALGYLEATDTNGSITNNCLTLSVPLATVDHVPAHGSWRTMLALQPPYDVFICVKVLMCKHLVHAQTLVLDVSYTTDGRPVRGLLATNTTLGAIVDMISEQRVDMLLKHSIAKERSGTRRRWYDAVVTC